MPDIAYAVKLDLQAREFPQPADHTEAMLESEIGALWSVHQETRTTVRRSQAELRTQRLDLGGKLYQMKSLLARVGRSGGWAAYLRSHSLPRSTIERLIDRHQASLKPKEIDPGGSFPVTSEDSVRHLVQSLLPRLRRVLTSPSWIRWFTAELEYEMGAADGDQAEL